MAKTIKVLKEKIGINLCTFRVSNGFPAIITKSTNNNREIRLIKLKTFLLQEIPPKK